MKRGTLVTELYLVKLKSDRFSVPKGTLGVVIPIKDRMYADEEEPTMGIYSVRWFEAPGPGGSSAPIHEHHLEVLGRLYIPLEIVESKTPHKKLEESYMNIHMTLVKLCGNSLEELQKLTEDEEEESNERSQNVS